jgi:hypothetical protein
MEIVINKTTDDSSIVSTEVIQVEDYSYENISKHFASHMWNSLIGEKIGDDQNYIADWWDYTTTYNTNRYNGEGIYNAQGVVIMHVEELIHGISELKVGNVKYFI